MKFTEFTQKAVLALLSNPSVTTKDNYDEEEFHADLANAVGVLSNTMGLDPIDEEEED